MGLFNQVLFFLGGVALHATVTQRAQPVPDEHLATADCQHAQLSAGRTCYRLDGPTNAPLVVLVHGFSGSHRNWAKTCDSLVEHSFRVLSYPDWFTMPKSLPHYVICPVALYSDLYGRGYSDATAEPHTLPLFVSQLAELVFSLDLGREPFVLAGISMGGPIAGTFARTYPSRVRRLLLVAPAGLRVHKPLLGRLAEQPLVGEVALPLLGKGVLSSHLNAAFFRPDAPGVKEEIEAAQRFNDQMADGHPGFFPSLLSTMRHFPLGGAAEEYADLGASDIPTLVVWGKQDQVVPTANSQLLAELPPHAAFAYYDQCGHVPLVEAAEAFMGDLLAFARDGAVPQ